MRDFLDMLLTILVLILALVGGTALFYTLSVWGVA